MFDRATDDIRGNSWLDDLARASLVAATAKFAGEPGEASLRVELVGARAVDAYDSWKITKAVQDATAKLGHVIAEPTTEATSVRASDRDRAKLVQRAAAGNVVFFSFPRVPTTGEHLDVGRSVTLAERAAHELCQVLPDSVNDDSALDAVLGQRLTIRNAVNDIVDAVSSTRSIEIEFTGSDGSQVGSVMSTDQARVLKENLRVVREEVRQMTVVGRLDGVRTKRRIFYLEPSAGPEIHGAVDLELLDDIRAHLNDQVTAVLEVRQVESVAGRRSWPAYRLLSLSSAPTLA
jgi:hypothetical protein